MTHATLRGYRIVEPSTGLWEQHFQRYVDLHFTSEILSR